MATYTVHLTTTVSTSIEVEAEDRDAAIESAFQSDQMPSGLCAYCTGYGQKWNLDMAGDWDVDEVDGPPDDESTEG